MKGYRALAEQAMNAKPGVIYSAGMTGGQTAPLCSQIYGAGFNLLLISPTYDAAKKLSEHLNFFAGDSNVILLPDEEKSTFSFDARSRQISYRRIRAISASLSKGTGVILVAPILAALKGMISPAEFKKQELTLEVGSDLGDTDIRQILAEMGYERVSMTEARGQYSVRGGITDVFPPDAENPYRIDMFGTEIDDIKQYDPMTQRSLKAVSKITVIPAKSHNPSDKSGVSFIWDYMPENTIILADSWDRICSQMELNEKLWDNFDKTVRDRSAENSSGAESDANLIENAEVFGSMETLAEALQKRISIVTTQFVRKLEFIDKTSYAVSVSCMEAANCGGRMDYFAKEAKRLLKEDYEVHIVCSTEERKNSLWQFADSEDIHGNIRFEIGYMPAGYYYSDDRIAYISDADIFKTVKKKTRRSERSSQIKAFTDFHEGDYVVHENYGIGVFVGVKPMIIENARKDYMAIRYAKDSMLYIPMEQMDMIQPYIGSGGDAPKLNTLGSMEWKRTKAKAKAAIEGMAEELIKLSAERKMDFGYSFGPDTAWQREFENMFPYRETDDQLKCIEEIKQDMEMPFPMDRLLCGDVGFGKTEVAARAVFKCIMDGKQAAVLVPTTILANQHYKTFKERFEKFPCNIDMISRFRTPTEQAKTIKGVADGSVDVLIGTHRLLSKDIKYKDLGLLVIDEEQRFGVQHKEKIKQIKRNVDVLSLSATPIPRTLHMSLSGIRSMSTLEEPPDDRYPVQTFVLEQDDRLIREVILRELDRDGQVFLLYNRVNGINMIAGKLRELVPEARIAVGHGQMSEKALEDVMLNFIDHEYDVLVATTIIESGIDIPAANTLIILDSDRFGLAQLYQLRGRVGRSDVPAYAYLMYKKDKVLSELAEKRLKAIREFTEFGSGFRVAMKDLELRGAGNLLGTEQSGHMMNIGYELYCKLIDEAVRKLKGEKVTESDLEVSVEIKTDAYIPSEYISDENVRLDMYKRIAEIKSTDDMSDVTDEFIDRFGNVPEETISLMKVAIIQALSRKAGIVRVSNDWEEIKTGGVYKTIRRIRYDFNAEKNLFNAENVEKLSKKYGGRLFINSVKKPYIALSTKNSSKMLDEAVELLETF